MPPSKDEAINLLSLDGGGVRGAASLIILHQIMVKIQEIQGLDEIPKPCDFFHMIGGTSTGGLIAIMLGRLRMSTEEALREYDTCAEKIFSFGNKKWSTATEKFRATALQDAVRDLVRRRDMGEELYDQTARHNSKGKCFVCTMPAKEVGEPWRLRSFYSESGQFDSRVKIWDAARATTAATFYFKPTPLPLLKGGTGDFLDAAIGCNNPAEFVIKEAADCIGSSKRLGCLISIGTGTRLVQMEREPPGLTNYFRLPRFLKSVVGTLKNTATDGEGTHRRLSDKLGGNPGAYFRFNIPDAAAQVSLDEYHKMDILKAITATHLDDPSVAAQVLAAAAALGCKSPAHVLSLGHIDRVDRDQIIPVDDEVPSFGNVSRFFVGRDDVLARLDACFPVRDTGGKPRREFLLYGMGGVGKTQTALKAADNLENRFKFVFSVDGTDTLTATKSYAKICQDHCQQGDLVRGTAEEMKNAALKWIGNLSEEWLMIYDNHPDHERLKPILPSRHSGNIIYTSRSRGLLASLPADCVCKIKPLAESHAVDLLLGISGREHFRSDEGEAESAHELVEKLGHLPLAIESAGAYIRQREISVLTYLHAFRGRAQRSALLSNPESDSPLPARPGLYTALDLSYDAISIIRRRKGTSVPGMSARFALKALNLLCFYHCEDIPVIMFSRAATQRYECGGKGVFPLRKLADPNDPDTDATELLHCQLPKSTWDPVSFDLGARLLQRFSLVKFPPGKALISMHVMVQEWALDRMKPENRPRQATMARIVLSESLKLEKTLDDHIFLRLMAPHVHACLSHESATGLVHAGYQAQLDIKLGMFYKEENQFSAAAEYLAKSASICEVDPGPNSRAATFALGMLANIYRDMGRWRDAERIYRDVIERLHIRKEQLTAADEEGLVRLEEGEQSRKTTSKEQAGSLGTGNHLEKTQGIRPLAAAGSSSTPNHNLAALKRTAKALEQLVRTIQSENLYEAEHHEPETMEDWSAELASVGADLGLALLEQGRFGVAKKCWMHSISIFKEAGYPQDLRIWLLEDDIKLHFEPEDVKHWKKRSIDRRALPPDTVDDLISLQSSISLALGYATAMLETGSPKDGYEVYESCLKNTTRCYGASDRVTLMLVRNMAACQIELGRFEEAEELARTALERARACYGQHHLQTAQCLLRLSQALLHQTLDNGPGSEYFGILQEAYDSARLAFSDDHYLAVQIKRRIDRHCAPPSPTASLTDEEADAEVEEYFVALEEAVAKAGPLSAQDFETLKNVTFREWRRQKNEVESEAQTPQAKSPTSKEVEVGPKAGSAQRQEGASSVQQQKSTSSAQQQETASPAQQQENTSSAQKQKSTRTAQRRETARNKSRRKKKHRATQGATTPLSPILEGDTSGIEGWRDASP